MQHATYSVLLGACNQLQRATSVRRATRKVTGTQVRCPPSPPTPSPSISPSASAPPSPHRLPEQVVAGKRLRSLLRMHGHTLELLPVGSEGPVPASASTSSASRQREIIELSDDESVANPPAVTALLSPEAPHPRRRPNKAATTPVAACSRSSAPAIHPAAAPPLATAAGAGPRLADLKRVVAAWKVRPIRVRPQLQPAARSRSQPAHARLMSAEASTRTLRR